MWFIFITARLFIFLSFQPRLAATLLRSCSVVNSLTRRAGLAPAFQPTSLAQPFIHLYWKPSLVPPANVTTIVRAHRIGLHQTEKNRIRHTGMFINRVAGVEEHRQRVTVISDRSNRA